MITITNNTLRSIGAFVSGNYIRFATSELFDENKPESSNNGNYREYAEFVAGENIYRYSMSYHGDIEPYPDWEYASAKDWERELVSAVMAAKAI